ncbi:MAG: TPM domain-containing protein [Nanoarchaeota archaeon]|nr:TPM domain-containing protein [Nanoarchaeota archaeon]
MAKGKYFSWGMIVIVCFLSITFFSDIVNAAENSENDTNAYYTGEVSIKSYVNDYADIFTSAEESELTSIAQRIYDSERAQYAIVTVRTTGEEAIDYYSINLAQGKLGDTDKDNGLLLLIAVDDRNYRFEVGSGLEGMFNDAKIGRIGRVYIVPNFINEEYGKGTIEASLAIETILINQTDPEELVSAKKSDDLNNKVAIITIIIIVLIVAIAITAAVIHENKLKKEGKESRYFGAAAGATTLFGGGFGRGGFGGGGFGGGGFGGGGAGGGW